MNFIKRFRPRIFKPTDTLLQFGTHSQIQLPRTLRCLVWNMYKAQRREWITDFQHLISDCDLVLLQEAIANSPTDAVFKNSPHHHWFMARSHEHPLSKITTGVKTGSIAPALNAAKYLSPHKEPIVGTQKSMLATTYKVQGVNEALLVLNIHAINFVGVEKFIAHMDQVGEVVSNHSGPVLLAGDFNTWRGKRRRHFDSVAKVCGLSQAHWQRKTQLMHLHQHLDRVYFRGMLPVKAESLHHISSSDHKPIALTLRF